MLPPSPCSNKSLPKMLINGNIKNDSCILAHFTADQQGDKKTSDRLSASLQPNKLDFCDGLRGYFALLVVWGHFDLYGKNYLPRDYHFFAGVTHAIGMSGFFVLSSFLLTYRLTLEISEIFQRYHYSSKLQTMNLISKTLAKFAIRRFFRIYPLFWVVGALFLLAPEIFNPFGYEIPKKNLLGFFTLSRVCSSNLFWTLSVEVKSYFIIPFIALIAAIPKTSLQRLCALFAVIGMIMASHFFWGPNNNAEPNLTPWLSVFLSGALVGALLSWREQGDLAFFNRLTLVGKKTLNILAIILFATISVLVSEKYDVVFWRSIEKIKGDDGVTLEVEKVYGWYRFGYTCFPGYIIAAIFLIASFTQGDGGYFTHIFSFGPLRFVGRVSYSFYLWHFTVIIHVTKHLIPDVLMWQVEHFLLITVSCVLVATLSFWVIEKPAMQFGAFLNKIL